MIENSPLAFRRDGSDNQAGTFPNGSWEVSNQRFIQSLPLDAIPIKNVRLESRRKAQRVQNPIAHGMCHGS